MSTLSPQRFDEASKRAQARADDTAATKLAFLKKLASAEADHALALHKLHARFANANALQQTNLPHSHAADDANDATAGAAANSASSVHSAWGALLNEVAARATSGETFSRQLTVDVIAPLADAAREVETSVRSLALHGQAELKELRDMHSEVKAAQLAWRRETAAAEEAAQKAARARSTPGKRPKELKKLEEKEEVAARRLGEVRAMLTLREEEAEDKQRRLYSEDMPQLLCEVVANEERRVGHELVAFERYAELCRERRAASLESARRLAESISSADVDVDVQDFVAAANEGQGAASAPSLVNPLKKGRLHVAELTGDRQRSPKWHLRHCVLTRASPARRSRADGGAGGAADGVALYLFKGEDSAAPVAALQLLGRAAAPTAADSERSNDSIGSAAEGADGFFVSPVHVSVFNKLCCFRLSHARASHAFQALDDSEYHAWVSILASLGETTTPSRSIGLGEVPMQRNVHVTVVDAKSLPRDADYSCTIYVDHEVYGRTSTVRGGPDLAPAWDAAFSFESVHPHAAEVRVLLSGSRLGSLLEWASGREWTTRLRLRGVDASSACEEWRPLLPADSPVLTSAASQRRVDSAIGATRFPPKKESITRMLRRESSGIPARTSVVTPAAAAEGTASQPMLRLKVWEEIVLLRPPAVYEPLTVPLSASPAVIVAIVDACGGADRDNVACAILRSIDAHGELARMLPQFVRMAIDEAGQKPELLFRANTALTKLLECYSRLCCPPTYRADLLRPCVSVVYAARAPCEVDPSKCADPAEVRRAWRILLARASGLWSDVCRSADACPETLRILLSCVRSEVGKALGDAHPAALKAVSGVYFLRFLGPALQFPHLCGVMLEAPSEAAARTLTLLTKSLIQLTNLEGFGHKEPYMAEMDEAFVQPNMPAARELLKSISEPSSREGAGGAAAILFPPPPNELRRRLASLSATLRRHGEEVLARSDRAGAGAAARVIIEASREIDRAGTGEAGEQLTPEAAAKVAEGPRRGTSLECIVDDSLEERSDGQSRFTSVRQQLQTSDLTSALDGGGSTEVEAAAEGWHEEGGCELDLVHPGAADAATTPRSRGSSAFQQPGVVSATLDSFQSQLLDQVKRPSRSS